MSDRERFIKIATDLEPVLYHKQVKPVNKYSWIVLDRGEKYVLDFGDHHVGYLSISLTSHGAHQDAPAYIRIRFCESARELDERSEDYNGWISRSWIQEEFIHVDVLPCELKLPRRYAFRYVCIEVIDTSSKYSLVIEDALADTVTSADDKALVEFIGNEREKRLYDVSVRTLRGCMQRVFEDGPKRDRRLWIGDLRLQALSNGASYKDYKLVKRCLYLFAGCTDEEGRVPACLFLEPEITGDNVFMFDYSLFFIAVMADYLKMTDDTETARDLLETALKQWEVAARYFDDDDVIKDSDKLGWCFLDWNLELNKQAGAQFVYIYCIRRLSYILKTLGETEQLKVVLADAEAKVAAADRAFFDKDRGLYVSGSDRQISYATQSWAIISGSCDKDRAAMILWKLMKTKDALPMVTPYMNHVYVEALIEAGMRREAYEHMIRYWGGMTDDGADTFYELYNPDDPDESPYGSSIVNSYCHAWSCTPVYFMKERGLTEHELESVHI